MLNCYFHECNIQCCGAYSHNDFSYHLERGKTPKMLTKISANILSNFFEIFAHFKISQNKQHYNDMGSSFDTHCVSYFWAILYNKLITY